MLTPSVNVVQSSFPEDMQGEISGLSRSVSNLGSSFGTAIAGTILVSVVELGTRSYAVAMLSLAVLGLLGLAAALLLPRGSSAPSRGGSTPRRAARSAARTLERGAESRPRVELVPHGCDDEVVGDRRDRSAEGARRRPGASPCANAVRPPRQHRQRAAERGAAEQERRGNRNAAHLG